MLKPITLKMFHEILSGFIREQSQDASLIKLDLLDYVLGVGIRFLSGFPGEKSLETFVFSCLTSFKYIENRIQRKRIEVFSLIEDYKLVVDCQFYGEGRKKEILFEVCSALEKIFMFSWNALTFCILVYRILIRLSKTTLLFQMTCQPLGYN